MNPFTNWKTTSAGLLTCGSAVVNLVFAVKKGVADQTLWTLAISQILGGLGLIFAGDADKSASKEEVAAVRQAVSSGDTTPLKAA